MLILVIDDQDGIRRFVRRILERAGHRVREAENGKAALAVLEANRPDLILTDLSMPEMDGIEFASVLRSRSDTAPPLIAMSGAVEAGMLLDMVRLLGAVDTLTKPFSGEELLAAVARVEAG